MKSLPTRCTMTAKNNMIRGSAGGAYEAQRTHHHHGMPLGQRSKKRWLMLFIHNNSAVHTGQALLKREHHGFGALCFVLGPRSVV